MTESQDSNTWRTFLLLRARGNCLLFRAGRGWLSARLVPPTGPLEISTADSTLPDLIGDERVRTWGAAVIIKASRVLPASVAIEAPLDGGSRKAHSAHVQFTGLTLMTR